MDCHNRLQRAAGKARSEIGVALLQYVSERADIAPE